MSNNGQVSSSAIEELIETATVLSEEHGELVAEAVRAAKEQPVDQETARRLYSRILEILHRHEAEELSDAGRTALAADISRRVEEIVGSASRPASDASSGVHFVTRDGLQPREVVPVPTFNGKAIPMTEGYVDVETLALWEGNARLALVMQEFEERNGRRPDDREIEELMHGSIHLPSLDKKDPFKLKPLAESIARKGVEVPPIVTYEGEPKDGNRRISASLLVLHSKDYDSAQKEQARYIRVWRAPAGTTDDQFDAIVVSRNFESDHKEPWPEFIKGRLVVDDYERRQREIKGRVTTTELRRIRREVATAFAITMQAVERYSKMFRWADDFSAYHEEKGENAATVRYQTEKNFQWFYELDAGRGSDKLTAKLDADDELKEVVYDLMFSVLDSGAQVRDLHRVVADPEASNTLFKAHEVMGRDPQTALDLVEDAITEAKRRNTKRKSVGFDQFLKTMVDRLGTTPPDQWTSVETELLLEVRRVMKSTIGAIEGQTTVRAAHGEVVE